MDPHDAANQTFMGKVKSYSRAKGYGFITSDKVAGDIFFVHKSVPKEFINLTHHSDFFLEGKECAFTCEVSDDGKPTAVEIRLLADGGKADKGKGKSGRGKGTTPYEAPTTRSKGAATGGTKGAKGNGKANQGLSKVQPARNGAAKPQPRATRPGAARPGAKRQVHDEEPGVPLVDGRVEGTIKSYSLASKWGFANVDPSVGDFGDIFVHLTHLALGPKSREFALRDGDAIEFELEEVGGKPVAKQVTLIPREANIYASQWMKGTVKSFRGEFGFITTPRISGDIWFGKTDLPKSMRTGTIVDVEVMFRLVIAGQDGKPKAKMVNPLRGMDEWEGAERAGQVIKSLFEDEFIDETAVETLQDTDPDEFLCLLPDLEFYKAENASSFILGALSHRRKAFKGKGKGKGGGRSAPY
eukprot:GEMP01014862.1.p1 GENE.GEMP01014862.1~~GEMP01014862.1.p1  ORF type:complete len:428 (+),score=123.18 GEMP01014862.1:46-1284(+)